MAKTYISTKDTAKMIREALKVTFPGTKFSVKMNRGTGASWLSVSWTDGPTADMVDAVTINYQGSYYTGDDSVYESLPTKLISFNDGEMPVEVQFGCVGVNTHRDMGDEGKAAAIQVLIDNNRTMDIVDIAGELNEKLNRETVPTLYAGKYWLSRPWDLGQAVHQVWHQMDFSQALVKN